MHGQQNLKFSLTLVMRTLTFR